MGGPVLTYDTFWSSLGASAGPITTIMEGGPAGGFSTGSTGGAGGMSGVGGGGRRGSTEELVGLGIGLGGQPGMGGGGGM